MQAISAKLVFFVFFGLFITVQADAKDQQNKTKMHKWTCETNASSPTTNAEKKADETMSKKLMSAKDAFAYAFKHCRDCTKITCSNEEEGNPEKNNTSNGS